MAARIKSLDQAYVRRQSTLGLEKSTTQTTMTTNAGDRNYTNITDKTSDRGSSLGRTKVLKMMDDGSWRNQQRNDERMAKKKSINEVEALREVFYNFFDMKELKQGNNAQEKVLISMTKAESDVNPFFKYDGEEEEDAQFADSRYGRNSSQVYAYASNVSGIFDHLDVLHAKIERDAQFAEAY